MGNIGQVMSLAGSKLRVSWLAFWWCARSHQYGDCQSSCRCSEDDDEDRFAGLEEDEDELEENETVLDDC